MGDFEDSRADPDFSTRGDLLRALPEAQALFDHSDDNLRAGKGFTDDEGVHSTVSITVTDSRLNGGKPTLIPSVYDGGRLPDGDSIDRAVESGKTFPSRDTHAEINRFAPNISSLMGTDFADAAERKETP